MEFQQGSWTPFLQDYIWPRKPVATTCRTSSFTLLWVRIKLDRGSGRSWLDFGTHRGRASTRLGWGDLWGHGRGQATLGRWQQLASSTWYMLTAKNLAWFWTLHAVTSTQRCTLPETMILPTVDDVRSTLTHRGLWGHLVWTFFGHQSCAQTNPTERIRSWGSHVYLPGPEFFAIGWLTLEAVFQPTGGADWELSCYVSFHRFSGFSSQSMVVCGRPNVVDTKYPFGRSNMVHHCSSHAPGHTYQLEQSSGGTSHHLDWLVLRSWNTTRSNLCNRKSTNCNSLSNRCWAQMQWPTNNLNKS